MSPLKDSQRGLGERLDVQFHHPSRATAESTLNRSTYPTPKLAELVVVRNRMVIPATQDPDEILAIYRISKHRCGNGRI